MIKTAIIIGLLLTGLTKKAPPKEVIQPPITILPIKTALEIVQASSCKDYRWKERGKAPIGYIKGVAMLYQKHYCKPNETTKHFNHPRVNSIQDILNIYNKETMRDLFTLLISSGMWESSGKYFTGRDMSANFNNENSGEAGLFQTSYNASYADPYMKTMLDYKEPCLLEVFKEGVRTPDEANLKNWGKPDAQGYKYQKLSKECPAFHTEFSLIAFRKLNRHFGPSRSGKLEYIKACADMLAQIEKTCD